VRLGELSQRLRRADFLDGLGIYVGTHEVALAHVSKRFFTVVLRNARTFPLPDAAHPAERRQALAQAVLAFAQEHRVDTRRAYLCLPRAVAAFNRVTLPAAARENLAQVLEYEMEHLIPLPRDQVYFDYSVRPLGGDRLEVLLISIPREVVRTYLDALEDAFVRPRGIVLASCWWAPARRSSSRSWPADGWWPASSFPRAGCRSRPTCRARSRASSPTGRWRRTRCRSIAGSCRTAAVR
jgi:hypothetical protein